MSESVAFRRWPVGVVVVAACVLAVACGSTTQSGISTHDRAALLGIALRTGRVNYDPHPYDIQVVRTTVGRVDRLLRPGDLGGHPSGEQVYLLAMRGRFSCGACSPPPGARNPRGSVITLDMPVGLRDHDWSAFSIGRPYPNLRRLGTPVQLGE